MKTGKTGSEQTVGDACSAVIENGTATLSPDIAERIGKAEVRPSAALGKCLSLETLRAGQVQSIIEAAFNKPTGAVVVCTKCGHEYRWDMRADQVPGKRCGHGNCDGQLADPRVNIEAQRFYLANLLIQSGVAIPHGTKVVIEHGTCELSPDIVERIGKAEVKPPEIAQCPFCGGAAKHTFGMNEHWVSCTVCGASGPMSCTKQKALDVWNTRHSHPEAMTPTQRAAFAALDFCSALDVLSADEACKAIEVMKQRLAISLIKAAEQKEVPHA